MRLSACLYSITVWQLLCGGDASAYQQFGVQGSAGQAGAHGSSGQRGFNRSIQAVGNPQRVDASGSDGSFGQYGHDGWHAQSCSQPMVASDLQGASGGNGGSGGSGGNGGDGGDVTVFYDDLVNLEVIHIYANGGRGGTGAQGGRGGQPCFCSSNSWVIDGVTYRCVNGNNGQYGFSGNQGNSGRMGGLTLIPQLAPLGPVSPRLTVAFPDLEAQSITVSDHRWEMRQGARRLFASDSRIPDQYRYYDGRIESTLKVEWLAERPISDFLDFDATVFLDGELAVLSVPSDLWLLMTTGHQGSNTQVKIEGALTKKEAMSLVFKDLVGANTNLVSVVEDESGFPDLVTSQFTVHYYTKGAVFWRHRYSGNINPSLVHRDGSEFTIDIGKLPIHPADLEPGIRARVFLEITRSVDGNRATRELVREETLQ